MTHLFRFFSALPEDSSPDGSSYVYLPQEEVKHLKIVRLQVGGKLEVFDGKGTVYACVLSSIGKLAKCEVLDIRHVPAARTKVIAAMAVQQSSMFGEVLRSLTELGVDTFVLFRHQRDAAFKLQKHGHWHKVIVNACKQAKRAWLPEVKLLQNWQEVLDYLRQHSCILIDKSGEHSLPSVEKEMEKEIEQEQDICFITGASCGYDAEELASLRSIPAVKVVNLGSNTLRAATAAIYVGGYLSLRREGR